MKYEIFMDVSGDIDTQEAEKNGLKFIPMEYSVGDEMKTCVGIESYATLKRFYDGQRGGDLTKTSQINQYMYEEFFAPYLEKGITVLCLCLSSGLSSTFSAATLAAENLNKKYENAKFVPVDTLSATAGLGILCNKAFKNRENGLSAEENKADLDALKTKIKMWFYVQDLNYLKRGGRISPATAFFGSMLNIKPILVIDENGKLITTDKKRGDKAAANHLVETLINEYDENAADFVYVGHADNLPMAEYVEEKIKEAFPSVKVKKVILSPIIGAHTGPGMVFVGYISK